jgi:hypothetical protein
MNSKLSFRQRAISDYELAEKKSQLNFLLQIIEGRLYINVSRLGAMYPYTKLYFGNEIWKSEASVQGGMHPKWNQTFSLSSSTQRILELVVYDRSLIFGETEIGRCTVDLHDVVQGHQTEWWDILSPLGELAGSILMSFEFPQPEIAPMHNSNNSWDFKMHHHVESSPVVMKLRTQNSLVSHRTPDTKIMHCNTEPDEICDLEQLRCELIEEGERINHQEVKVKQFFDKLKVESVAIKGERKELKKNKEVLQMKEEIILKEKERVELDKESIDKDREEIKKMKETLNLEYLKLKMEKLKVKTQKRLLEKLRRKMNESSMKVDKQKKSLHNDQIL